MPYSIAWYVERQVVFVRYTGQFTAEEFQDYLQTVERDYLDQGEGPLVHILVDISQAASTPTLKQLAAGIGRDLHPKSGWMIVIGVANPAARWIGEFVSTLFRFRYRSFSTLSDALAFLKDMDQTIDWAKADESVLA